jgi:membrane protease YdiL (CAAX protease family)
VLLTSVSLSTPHPQSSAVAAAAVVGAVLLLARFRSSGTRIGAILAAATAVGASLQDVLRVPWQVVPILGLALGMLGSSEVRSRIVGLVTPRRDLPWASISILALVVGFALRSFDQASEPVLRFLPEYPILLLALGAVINGLVEEVVWREGALVMMREAGAPPIYAICAQAVAFGLAHYAGGYPTGVSGVALAAAFGAVAGCYRVATKSLVPGVTLHVVADALILSIIM